MKPRTNAFAGDLAPGDVIHTAIGWACIASVAQTHGGIEVVIDAGSAKTTRPRGEGTVLWYFANQPVQIRGRKRRAA